MMVQQQQSLEALQRILEDSINRSNSLSSDGSPGTAPPMYVKKSTLLSKMSKKSRVSRNTRKSRSSQVSDRDRTRRLSQTSGNSQLIVTESGLLGVMAHGGVRRR